MALVNPLRRLLLVGVLVWSTVLAQQPKCIREFSATRLDTLQVDLCLLGPSSPQAGGDEADSQVVVRVRQTLKNVGTRPIEVELRDDPVFRMSTFVRDDKGKVVSKLPEPPRHDDPDYVMPKFEYRALQPGEVLEFNYEIEAAMIEPPRPGVKYFVGLQASYEFLFFGESRRDVANLRWAEEKKRGKHTPGSAIFLNVRLR